MTNSPTPDQVAESLARRVRNRLLAAEKSAATWAIDDFDDALRRADDAQEQIAICRQWARFTNTLKEIE